ncbi:MAG: signal peptidase II [Actinomycetota bacterium]|nr:signal peptidase II [Actinomycetota bacterium]
MQAARGASLSPSDHGGERDPVSTGDQKARLRLVLGIAVVAWVVDLVTKTLAVAKLDGHPPVHLVGRLLQLSFARNPGAAFSTGTRYTGLITALAVVAVVVVAHFARGVRSLGWAWALGLLLAGIAGNLTDRLFREPGPLRGHVVDFLQLPHWPVFNIADMCINVAAVVIVVQSLRGVRLDGHRPKTAT